MPDQARRQLGEERKQLRPSNLPPDHTNAALVDAVNLEHRLRNVQPNCDRLIHALSSILCASLQLRGGGEPSKASNPDVVTDSDSLFTGA